MASVETPRAVPRRRHPSGFLPAFSPDRRAILIRRADQHRRGKLDHRSGLRLRSPDRVRGWALVPCWLPLIIDYGGGRNASDQDHGVWLSSLYWRWSDALSSGASASPPTISCSKFKTSDNLRITRDRSDVEQVHSGWKQEVQEVQDHRSLSSRAGGGLGVGRHICDLRSRVTLLLGVPETYAGCPNHTTSVGFASTSRRLRPMRRLKWGCHSPGKKLPKKAAK